MCLTLHQNGVFWAYFEVLINLNGHFYNWKFIRKKCFSLYIDYMYTCISIFFFRKYSYTLAFEFDRKHYLSVYFYQMCFNSVLIPPVNRGPPEFFLIWIASKWHILCKFWGGVCGNQLQFWNRILIHLCIILNKSIVVNIFFSQRDRSLKLNTRFRVLYFDEVSMYNVIEFEFSKIRDTDRPVPLY